MNYSPYGGLCQAFIMHAVQHYAEEVIKTPITDTSLVSGKAWIGIAHDVKERCDAFYNRHNVPQVEDPAMPDDEEWDEVVAHFGLDSSFNYSDEAMKGYTHDYRVYLEKKP